MEFAIGLWERGLTKTRRDKSGINAKMRFLAHTKGRREKDRERKRKGKDGQVWDPLVKCGRPIVVAQNSTIHS